MGSKRTWVVSLLAAAFAVGCAYGPSFPVQEGDVDRGRQAFVEHQCHQCHSVSGVDLPDLAGAGPVQLELGGEILSAKTYAELITSIINPNHIISEAYRDQLYVEAAVPIESPMPLPDIDRMTVRQLIDLVTFLDSRYMLIEEYEQGM